MTFTRFMILNNRTKHCVHKGYSINHVVLRRSQIVEFTFVAYIVIYASCFFQPTQCTVEKLCSHICITIWFEKIGYIEFLWCFNNYLLTTFFVYMTKAFRKITISFTPLCYLNFWLINLFWDAWINNFLMICMSIIYNLFLY